ncbi:TraB/GumN family protein [Phenylobacterium sp. VNQ135]|uniref:TraB/GumN family protein n=1 Tax=Phenylobacterium sp. VNQ135 TaxID=3400922 RepID=UPI003C069DFB
MKAWFGAAVLAAAVMAGGAASAAQAQALPDPEATVVEELVVRAAEPGPAWWSVRDADTTVWILGVASDDLPAGVTWDSRTLERRLKGANTLIVGDRIGLTAKLTEVPALLRARGQLKSKTPLETTLPEPLRARFVAARDRAGQPARRYAGWTPLVAGQMLLADSRRGAKGKPVSRTVLDAAKRAKVKPSYPVRYAAMPYVRQAMASLTPELHERCLDQALDDAEAPAGRTLAAARAWAHGDVAGALAEPRSFEKCVLLLAGGAELWRQARTDQAAAIAKALETPGHAVAVVSLRMLLAEDGVAAALAQRGLEVTGPGGR